MSATLSIIDNFSLDAGNGLIKTAKQGNAADPPTTSWDVTVDGPNMFKEGSLATATVQKVYDSTIDSPSVFDYAHYWADQDSYIQFITAATNFIVKVAAKSPFNLSGFGKLLAAANTSAITGGAEPSVAAITAIYIGNYSGNTMNWTIAVVD